MTRSNSDNHSGFNSHDSIDIVIDGPGDTTVRPCRPELLRLALAEREKLIKWGKMKPTPLPPHIVEMLKQLEQDHQRR